MVSLATSANHDHQSRRGRHELANGAMTMIIWNMEMKYQKIQGGEVTMEELHRYTCISAGCTWHKLGDLGHSKGVQADITSGRSRRRTKKQCIAFTSFPSSRVNAKLVHQRKWSHPFIFIDTTSLSHTHLLNTTSGGESIFISTKYGCTCLQRIARLKSAQSKSHSPIR